MADENTRLTAIRALLEDETARDSRGNWETIFADKSLTPQTEIDVFQKQFYDLLITEMEEGYQRLDQVRREKRQRAGRRGGYIPPQMRINSTIGRYLFAQFKWHTPAAVAPNIGIETKGLEDIAEAFGFRIDPMENQRQFMKAEARQTVINKEKSADYTKWIWGVIFFAFSGSAIAVFRYLTRHGGF